MRTRTGGTRTPPESPSAADLRSAAARIGEHTPAALSLARTVGRALPMPGRGETAERWATLAALAEGSLTVARAAEPHLDALAILDEAGRLVPDDRDLAWGVFAAEAVGQQLTARTDGARCAQLSGVKPWCSLAAQLDAALVTAWVGTRRQLFRVDLHQDGVHVQPDSGWVARGLRAVTSVPVSFDRVPAVAVGDPDWYLLRPGFAWGGIGVAACWYGGARGLYRAVLARAADRNDDVLDSQVGEIDAALHAAGATLETAAATIDSGGCGSSQGAVLAERVRAVVAEAAERTLAVAGHALGPAALAFDAEHTARVADLQLYVRQHHGERDLATLGARVARPAEPCND